MPKLSEVYNDAAARAEGWIICSTDDWGDVIMKYDEDEAERFEWDDDAVAYVEQHHPNIIAALDAENPTWRTYYDPPTGGN